MMIGNFPFAREHVRSSDDSDECQSSAMSDLIEGRQTCTSATTGLRVQWYSRLVRSRRPELIRRLTTCACCVTRERLDHTAGDPALHGKKLIEILTALGEAITAT